MSFGYDKIVFGVIMIVNLEIGLLTPPVGLNLIVAMSAFRENFGLLVRAAVPFILLMILALGLISLCSRNLSLLRTLIGGSDEHRTALHPA